MTDETQDTQPTIQTVLDRMEIRFDAVLFEIAELKVMIRHLDDKIDEMGVRIADLEGYRREHQRRLADLENRKA